MAAALLKKQFESVLGGPLDWQSRPEPEWVRTGIPEIELPRGCLTEIVGPASSGRTTLLHSVLAAATAREKPARWWMPTMPSTPHSAAAAGVAARPPDLGALRAQRRACPQGGRPADPGRRLRRGRHGPRRYAAVMRAPHLAHFLVPPAPRRRKYPDRVPRAGPPVECQDLRFADDRVRGASAPLVRPASRRCSAASACAPLSTQRRKACSPVFTATAI